MFPMVFAARSSLSGVPTRGDIMKRRIAATAAVIGTVLACTSSESPPGPGAHDASTPIDSGAVGRGPGDASGIVDASSAADTSAPDAAIDATVDAPGGTDDASVPGEGCADGTREGFPDGGAYPDLTVCLGTWTGHIAAAGFLCAAGWHVC